MIADLRWILLMTMTALLTACSTRVADLTVVSPNTVSMKKLNLDELPSTRNVVGRDSSFVFLFIPLGLPNLEEAISDALAKGEGDLMIDTVIYRDAWSLLLFGHRTLRVQGTVINTRAGNSKR